MGALILAGLVQGALDAQDVLEAATGPAFSIEELGVRMGARASIFVFGIGRSPQLRPGVCLRH